MNIESTFLDRHQGPDRKYPNLLVAEQPSNILSKFELGPAVIAGEESLPQSPEDVVGDSQNGAIYDSQTSPAKWQSDMIALHYSGHGEVGRSSLSRLLPSQIAPALADVFSAHENFVLNTPPDLTTSIEIAVKNYAKQQLVTFLHEHAACAEVTPVSGHIDAKGRFMIGNFDMVAVAQKNLKLTPTDPRSHAELKGMTTLQTKLAQSDDVQIVLSPTKYAAENPDEEYGLGFVMRATTSQDGTRSVSEQIIRYKERMGESAVSKGLYASIAAKSGAAVDAEQLQKVPADQMFAQVLSIPKDQFDAAFGKGELAAIFGKTEIDEQMSLRFLEQLQARRGDMLQLYATLVNKNINIQATTPAWQVEEFVADSSFVVNKMFAYSQKLMQAVRTGDYAEVNALDVEIDRFLLNREDSLGLGEMFAISGGLNVLLPNVYMQNGQCPSAYALGSAMGQFAGGSSYADAMGGMLFGMREGLGAKEKVVATFKVIGKEVRAIECVKCPGCSVVGVHYKDADGRWHCANPKDTKNHTELSKAANEVMKKRGGK